MKSILFITLFVFLQLKNCSNSGIVPKDMSPEGRNLISKNGMVVSAHHESSGIGVLILKKGGNAVDAAVATEFALAVCYPEAGNIGGGGFMIYRDPTGMTDLVDYREKAPAKAFRDMYLNKEGEAVPGLSTESHLSSGVPGTVDGMISFHKKYGILPFNEVIQPAIDLAKKGFPVTAGQAEDLNNFKARFIKANRILPAFVKSEQWKKGDTLRQPDLAKTLERIRDAGRDGFYSGETAKMIVKEMERGNGIISEDDLAKYHSVFRKPVSEYYRGYKVISAGPPSGGGIILLQILGMIEPFHLKEMVFHSPESIHLLVEAEKRAFADRAEFLGDPDFTKIPVTALLDRGYLKHRMADFTNNRASESLNICHGNPFMEHGEETTHYSVVDPMGGAVSATTTLNGTFGSGIVVEGAGFLMNNQMDDFSLKPNLPNMYGLVGGKVNSIEGGKRMLSSMTPSIIEKEGKLFLVVGSPGGSTIPTTVLQVITNVIDFGMDIRQAVDTGRFHHQWLPDYIGYEKGSLDSSVIMKLKSMGHTLTVRSSLGRVNAIILLPDGRKMGGADIRGDNSACGY